VKLVITASILLGLHPVSHLAGSQSVLSHRTSCTGVPLRFHGASYVARQKCQEKKVQNSLFLTDNFSRSKSELRCIVVCGVS